MNRASYRGCSRIPQPPMTNDPPANQSPGSQSCTNTPISSSSGSGGLEESGRCWLGVFRRFQTLFSYVKKFTEAQKKINRVYMFFFYVHGTKRKSEHAPQIPTKVLLNMSAWGPNDEKMHSKRLRHAHTCCISTYRIIVAYQCRRKSYAMSSIRHSSVFCRHI